MPPKPAQRQVRRLKKPLRSLSIDGGGIRGIIPAVFLDCLLTDVNNKRKELGKNDGDKKAVKIHELFDLVCGTSTGAIITSALTFDCNNPNDKDVKLGRPLAPIEIFNFFDKKGPTLFQKSGLFGKARPWFDVAPLAQAMQDIYGKADLDELDLSTRPHTFVVSSRGESKGDIYLFRNHQAPAQTRFNSDDLTNDGPVWESVRASSAAPVYFDPFVRKPPPTDVDNIYRDGGIVCNNPTFAAISEMRRLWPGTGYKLSVVLSLGTGLAKAGDIPATWEYLDGTKYDITLATMSNSGPIEKQVRERIENAVDREAGSRCLYFRYSPEGQGNIDLASTDPDEYKQMAKKVLGDVEGFRKGKGDLGPLYLQLVEFLALDSDVDATSLTSFGSSGSVDLPEGDPLDINESKELDITKKEAAEWAKDSLAAFIRMEERENKREEEEEGAGASEPPAAAAAASARPRSRAPAKAAATRKRKTPSSNKTTEPKDKSAKGGKRRVTRGGKHKKAAAAGRPDVNAKMSAEELSAVSNHELRRYLRLRKLDTKGPKATLVERIRESGVVNESL